MSEKFDKVKAAAKEDQKWLIRIGIITLIVVVFYFIASPYQNCKRLLIVTEEDYLLCVTQTSW